MVLLYFTFTSWRMGMGNLCHPYPLSRFFTLHNHIHLCKQKWQQIVDAYNILKQIKKIIAVYNLTKICTIFDKWILYLVTNILLYFNAPDLARLSAASLPGIPRCPGTWVCETEKGLLKRYTCAIEWHILEFLIIIGINQSRSKYLQFPSRPHNCYSFHFRWVIYCTSFPSVHPTSQVGLLLL